MEAAMIRMHTKPFIFLDKYVVIFYQKIELLYVYVHDDEHKDPYK